MNRERISKAIGDIDGQFIAECAVYAPAKAGRHAGTKVGNGGRSIRRVLVLAAMIALLLALGTAAYATGWFGLKPLTLPAVTYTAANGQVEELQPITLSQPQAVPEELEEVNELAEKNRQAWEEFQQARRSSAWVQEYERLSELLYERSSGKNFRVDFEEREDGTVIASYYVPPEGYDFFTFDWQAKPEGPEYVFDHSKEIAKADYERFDEIAASLSSYECEYDFHYGLNCDEEKAMLEEVAAKYGLNLRSNTSHLVWSSETTGMTGPDFYTNEELAEMTGQLCAGNIFYETPAGFDKLYWYDEGSFGVSFDLDADGRQISCYGYNSIYTTLSTGREVISDYVREDETYVARRHVCPDGTELEILSNGRDAYFYVYLEDSFFAGNIWVNTYAPGNDGNDALSDAEIDFAADAINYSNIGGGK